MKNLIRKDFRYGISETNDQGTPRLITLLRVETCIKYRHSRGWDRFDFGYVNLDRLPVGLGFCSLWREDGRSNIEG